MEKPQRNPSRHLQQKGKLYKNPASKELIRKGTPYRDPWLLEEPLKKGAIRTLALEEPFKEP